ncbi:phosphomevalonate kinase [Tulasnella sp. JGI-2019a]|nr:phosphomevalonate kinase [Tulasnella sp. JGI-2019a]KAG9027269.1 phosphomevalonate kinase [Tulasnella sp. JGI-2019a]
MATIVSASGKVLLAGGYLVLDPAHSGIVVSTSSRFYSIIRESPSARPHQITVRSPQFLEATWSYDVLFSPRGEIGLRASVSNASKNKFVQLAIERVLFLSLQISGIQAARQATAQGLEIVIVGDNDFYSQRGQLAAMKLPSAIASLAKIPKFAATNCSLPDVHKTGLGSSAALITSLVGALLVHFSLIPASSLQTENEADEGRRLAHNVAQYVHCLAQGKVGSGFDVSSATYGSQIYKRFDPDVLQPLMSDDIPARLTDILSPSNKAWNHSVMPFKLPPLTRIMLADVDAGTDTPAAVGKVLAWRKQHADKAAALWTALSAANDSLAKALTWLSTLHQRSPGAYQTAVSRLVVLPHDKWSAIASGDEVTKGFLRVFEISEAIRAKMREMGNLSDVPIEPVEQTRLLDACIARPGVIAGGVPGAGGYDAIWLLVLTPPNNSQAVSAVESIWSTWREMNVSPLAASESHERGARLENTAMLKGLKL